jgi:hypothetical protein
MGKKKTRWTPKEKERLRDFLFQHRIELISTLYKNVLCASLNHRKRDFFFKEMSKKVRRSSSQCKSKFQKQESKIFTEYLLVPETHYMYFVFLRDQRQFFTKNKIEIVENEVINAKQFMKWVSSEQFENNRKLRLKILEEITENNQQIFINDKEKGKFYIPF